LFSRTAVQGHPGLDAQLAPGVCQQGALRGEARRDRIRRDRKRRMCTVAGGLDKITTVRLDGVAQDRIVARECPLHRRVLRFPQPSAALDVGEQERDRAGRQQPVSARCRRHDGRGPDGPGTAFCEPLAACATGGNSAGQTREPIASQGFVRLA
jgi:hypothetical protein